MITYWEILRTIEGSGADYVWIGLSAAGAYGSTLASYDFDFFVRPEAAHLDKAREAFRKLALVEIFPNVSSANLILTEATDTFNDPDGGPSVDLITKISGPSFDELWQHHNYMDFHGVRLRVASLEHIIASKRAAGREKDLYVIQRLKKELGDEVKETRARYQTQKTKRAASAVRVSGRPSSKRTTR